MKKVEEKLAKINSKYYGMITFALASLAMYLTLSFSQMLSNGIYIVMDADFIEQYIPYIKMFFRNLLAGEGLEYSWSNSLGMNTSLLYAYYVLSPFNLLYLIFWGVEENIITAFIIILKTGLCAYTFHYFLKKVMKCNGVETILFSLMYSLCSFTMLYGSTYNSWLEGVYMLPLIFVFVYELFEDGKIYKLIIAYAFLFATQFYMGYMVGVFSFVFWCILLFVKCQKGFRNKILVSIKYAGSVFLAIGISAAVWLPALLFLRENMLSEQLIFSDVSATLPDVWNNLFWGQMQGVEGVYPYIYCGLPVLLLFPFFFVNKKIERKRRITVAILLLFILLTMVTNKLYQVIHAFDSPNSYAYRQAFMMSFVLCALACKQSVYWENFKIKQLGIWAGICAGIYILVGWNRRDNSFVVNSNSTIFFFINVAFIVFWILMIYWKKKQKINAVSWSMIALFIILCELCTSGYIVISRDLENVGRKQLYYENWKANIQDVVEQVNEDKSFYRMYCGNDYVSNSDSWFGYNGIADFSTAEDKEIRLFCSRVGIYNGFHLVENYGLTEPVEMILGVKYYADMPSPYLSTEEGSGSIETNPYALSLGFAVDENILDCKMTESCAFENINQMLTSMTGVPSECFKEINNQSIVVDIDNASMQETDDWIIVKRLSGDGEGIITYRLIEPKEGTVYVQFIQDESEVSVNAPILPDGQENSVFAKGMISVSYVKLLEQNQVSIVMNENTVWEGKFRDVVFYEYDINETEKCFKILSSNQMKVLDYGNTYVNAEIEMGDEKEILFTSIPYSEGWTVKADGEEIEIIPVLEDAFIAIRLEPGYHNLEFEYKAPGASMGRIISFTAIVFCLLIGLADYIRMRKIEE